ncbi:Glycerol-3-phosphate dehydrogenase, FAD-dependent [Candidatus Sulfotelmatomonas gaucii]|uniref:Glycerol-3-phosphate dehydrogenase, FAD-dependent n=1 Tax=Candidatus Sulfuritelmatomonas gaucii TaxID=2043161 RepID=A0A2N9L642_9BACT|nr:Glycerol-3-phosphate dehydrogenase, FAD-dependent [Candidatus Sulfotelmatomonas gaucii]
MTRNQILHELGRNTQPWDVLVIGGGATGLGAAVEAASRGYRTLLVERSDFAKETSSRSTKLVHGGVRYLEQMNLTLVLDALRERGHMLRNAPHLVHDLSFVVPAYSYFSLPYYGMGLKLYERLSGKLSFGRSELLSRKTTLELLPGVTNNHLRGGILYHDGQFDDARYAVSLVRTLQDLGGIAINYVEAIGLIEHGGKIAGIQARDVEDDTIFDLRARAVINACGVHAEDTLALDGRPRGSLLAISQGSHYVLPRSFLPGNTALMIPKTSDGRVLFAIPWHSALVVGTTDVPVDTTSPEPRVLPQEKQFLNETIARYFGQAPRPGEILSVWSGLRPLVRKGGVKTSKLSRDHTILIAPSGLITVTGGKWTTYRRMGQDTIDRAAQVAALPKRPSNTLELKLHGWTPQSGDVNSTWESVYGSDLPALRSLSDQSPCLEAPLHPRLPFKLREVVWAARFEMARSVEDVLARRTRALFLDARAAIEAAPTVADLLAQELNRCEVWKEKELAKFLETAKGYLYEE